MKIKRRTLTLIMSWAIKLTIVGGITLFFYAYFGTGVFSITTYSITGVDEETRLHIEKQLHEQDTKKLYKIFPADKIFTYSSGNISKTVRAAVPELASLSTRPVGLHTVKVEITLLKPLFRVSDTQALTENGIIFTTKYGIHTYPRIVIASSTNKTIKNKGLVFTKMQIPNVEDEKEFLNSLSQMVSKISSVIFTVETVSIEEAGDVLCIDERGMSKVIFLKDSDYKKTWSTLVSSIDTDPLKTKLATDKEQLEYLDARYGNKVFYRFSDMAFQNGSVNGILGNHATTTQETSRSSSTTER